MYEEIAIIGGLGLIFGLGLAYAAKRFSVKENPKVEKVLSILPGNNCGACGFAGCLAFAKAVCANPDLCNRCVVGGDEVACKIGKILGVKAEKVQKKTARLFCSGGINCKDKFEYTGVKTCRNASLVSNGYKACSYGCLGFGDCTKVCQFDAIKIGKDNLPVIDQDKCTGCGMCVQACPRNLLHLVPKNKKVHVACSSHYAPNEVVQKCSKGCIACGICENSCPEKAAKVEDNLSSIDFSKCKNKFVCVEKCPRKVIVKS